MQKCRDRTAFLSYDSEHGVGAHRLGLGRIRRRLDIGWQRYNHRHNLLLRRVQLVRRINATLAWQHALRLVLSAAPRAVEPNQPVRLELLRSEAFLYTPVSMRVKPGALCEAERRNFQSDGAGTFRGPSQASGLKFVTYH